MNPVISVIIAVYNGEKFISETIESIINQTYVNWECIVVDDGSTDNTKNIVRNYIDNDSRIKLIATEGVKGPFVAANIGIKASNGTYIARIDADDIALPERLEKQLCVLLNNSDKKVCCSSFLYLFNDNTTRFKPVIDDVELLRYSMIFKNTLLHSSAFFEKEWFVKIGLYPEKRLAQDYYLWCKSLIDDNLVVLSEPLVMWRMWDNSITKKENGLQTQLALEINNWYLSQLFDDKIHFEISNVLFGTFRNYLKTKDFDNILNSLDLLNKFESKIRITKSLLLFKSQMLYTIGIYHINQYTKLFIYLFKVMSNDRHMVFSFMPYKLLIKFLVKKILVN